ncbi:hypothetical protein V1477_008793 [Vespula maculifrons]|uniref:Uncharacterized protein n=1 Tax=Vespula maculifrons TaxID=7453 RepID=A0ABD2CE05_VESMC
MDSDDDSVLGNRFIALRHINQSQMPIVPTDTSTEVGIGRRLKDGNRFALATSSKVNLFALPQTQPHRSDRDTEGTGYKMGGWFNLQREPLGFYRGLLPRNFALSGSANPRALDKRF